MGCCRSPRPRFRLKWQKTMCVRHSQRIVAMYMMAIDVSGANDLIETQRALP